MDRQQIRLDRSTVAKLKLDDGKSDQIFFDADDHGFGLRIRADGGRQRQSWIVQYRVKGRTRRAKIGDYPTVSPDQARKKAKTILASIQLGADPQAEKEAQRAKGSRTLRSVADQYLEMKELEMQRGSDRLGKIAPWNLHDIRRSVATWMAENNIEPHVIEAILNHHSGHRSGVAGVYNRAKYARQMRTALTVWSDHLRSLIEGGARKVLTFPQGAHESA